MGRRKSKERPWDDSTGDQGVMRRWTLELSRRMQAVLVGAIRGCDGAPKHDPSKALMWALRWDCMNPDDAGRNPAASRSFMGYKRDLKKQVALFFRSLDQYPFHFIAHFMHAAEICGYCHPDGFRKLYWHEIYETICRKHLHVTPESCVEMLERLKDGTGPTDR